MKNIVEKTRRAGMVRPGWELRHPDRDVWLRVKGITFGVSVSGPTPSIFTFVDGSTLTLDPDVKVSCRRLATS